MESFILVTHICNVLVFLSLCCVWCFCFLCCCFWKVVNPCKHNPLFAGPMPFLSELKSLSISSTPVLSPHRSEVNWIDSKSLMELEKIPKVRLISVFILDRLNLASCPTLQNIRLMISKQELTSWRNIWACNGFNKTTFRASNLRWRIYENVNISLLTCWESKPLAQILLLDQDRSKKPKLDGGVEVYHNKVKKNQRHTTN